MKKILINKKSAELIGIILGDGSINVYKSEKYSTFYRFKISFNSDEKAYIEYVKTLIISVLNEEPKLDIRKNEKTSELLIFKKNIVEHLLELGLINSPKWNRAVLPNLFFNKKFGKYVLRGYFDTDGCITRANNNGTVYPRIEMKIMPSPMKNQLVELLRMYNFNFGVYEIGKGEVRVQINGKTQLKKWHREIGFSNEKNIIKNKKFL